MLGSAGGYEWHVKVGVYVWGGGLTILRAELISLAWVRTEWVGPGGRGEGGGVITFMAALSNTRGR